MATVRRFHVVYNKLFRPPHFCSTFCVTNVQYWVCSFKGQGSFSGVQRGMTKKSDQKLI